MQLDLQCLSQHMQSRTYWKNLQFAFLVFGLDDDIFSLFGVFFFFFFSTSWRNLKLSGSMTRNPGGWLLFTSTRSSKDLFKISIHNQCFPWKSLLTLSPLNIHVRNPFEFCGKNTVTSISIFMWVAGSIFIAHGE